MRLGFSTGSPNRFVVSGFVLLSIAVSLTEGIAAEADSVAGAPGAPRLLPEQTFAYVRVEDVDQLKQDLADSSVGQMLADPKLRPFVGDLYSTAAEIFAELASDLGISLEELIEIPHGQFAVGLVATGPPSVEATGQAAKDDSPEAIRARLEKQRGNEPGIGWLLIIETGEDHESLTRVLEFVEQQVIRSGAVARAETVSGTRVERFVTPDTGKSVLEYFHRDGATVIGFGPAVASDALARWDGRANGRTLAESTDFAAVMGRCIGAADTRPQITFFADPYRFLRQTLPSAGVAQAIAWQVLQELGIGKIRGLGASTFHGGDVFADIAHAHILIDPPRDGIFSVLRPQAGDTNPPSWVPDDVTSYRSIGWRVGPTYDGLGRILDRFQGEGALDRLIEEPYRKRVGGEFRRSIIEAVDDRIVMIRWLQPPVRINSSTSINAVKLKDPSSAMRTIGELQKAFPAVIREESIGATPLFLFATGRDRPLPDGLRRPTPCAAIVGDWLLTGDSREFIERAIRARDGAMPRLSGLAEYDLLASELGGELAGDKPFMLSFTRSAEVLRQVYELAKADQSQAFLRGRGESNPVARGLAELLRRNELPPFDEFRKYFAPTGTFAYDEANGIHLGRFTLKPWESD